MNPAPADAQRLGFKQLIDKGSARDDTFPAATGYLRQEALDFRETLLALLRGTGKLSL